MEQNEEKISSEEGAKWNMAESSRKKKSRGGLIALVVGILVLCGLGAGYYFKEVKPANEYKAAVAVMEEGRYDEAIAAFEAMGDYEDAPAQIRNCLVQKTVIAVQEGKYGEAKDILDRLGNETIVQVNEAVHDAFLKNLEKLDTAQISSLLEKLGSCIGYADGYKEHVREAMEKLIEKGDDDKALELEKAAAALKPEGLLEDIVSDAGKACMESGDLARAKELLVRFGDRTASLAETVRYHVLTRLGEGDYEGALAMIDAFAGTSLDFNAQKYSIGVSMINAGEYEKATEIFAALGDYEDSKDMLTEIDYRELNGRLIERMKEGTALQPEEFAEFYMAFLAFGDHGSSTENRQNLLHAWIDTSLSSNDAEPYLTALTGTVKLSKEDKEDLLVYMLKNTPIMAEVKEDRTIWYCTAEEMKDYRTLMDVLFKGSKDIRAQAFLHYMDYLASQDVTKLPSNQEIKALWDLRSDMLDFCKTGDPLLMFLAGRWTTSKDGQTIEVTRRDDGYFFVSYHLPTDEVNVYVEASKFGLNSFDPNRMTPESGEHAIKRVCTIEIADFDTIKVYNEFDDTIYTLTRVSK